MVAIRPSALGIAAIRADWPQIPASGKRPGGRIGSAATRPGPAAPAGGRLHPPTWGLRAGNPQPRGRLPPGAPNGREISPPTLLGTGSRGVKRGAVPFVRDIALLASLQNRSRGGRAATSREVPSWPRWVPRRTVGLQGEKPAYVGELHHRPSHHPIVRFKTRYLNATGNP